jgi:hypothetical protein
MTSVTDQTGFPLAGWRDMIQHAVAIAVLSEGDHSSDGATPPEPPEFAIFTDVKEEEKFLAILLDELFPALQAEGLGVELGVFQFQGETIHQIANQHFQAYYAIIDQTFLAAESRDILQRLVQEFKHESVSSKSHTFAEAFQVSPNSDVHVTIQLPALWSHIRSNLIEACSSMPRTEKNLLFSFLENYHWPFVTWNLTLRQDSIYERLHVTYPYTAMSPSPMPPRESTDTLLSQHRNRRFVSDRLISDQVIYYGARHINMPAWWQNIQSFIQQIAETDNANELELWLSRIESLLQKPLSTFLSELGDVEIAGAWYPPEFVQRRSRRLASLSQIPLVLMLHTDARHDLERALQHMLTALRIPTSRTSFQDREIVAYQLPVYGETIVLFQTIVDDVFLFSGSENIIRESIRRADYGQSLSEKEDYRAGFVSFPSLSLTRGYLNLSEFMRLLNTSRNRQELVYQGAFPSALTDMMPSLSPMAWVTTVEPHGFLTTSRSPLGGPIAGLLTMWLFFLWVP